jgi:prepilin-type processing-associated H-X9-DG protein
VVLLPYIEQAPLYKTVNPDLYLQSNGTNQTWRNVRSTEVSIFNCPSDSADRTPCSLNGGGWARGNYAANAGPGWFNGTVGGAASSSPRNTYADRPAWGGVMGINWGANFIAIRDGTSNTVMLTELRVGLNDVDRRGVWAMGLAGASVTAANGSTGDCPTPNDANEFSDDVEDCKLIRERAGFALTSGMGVTGMGCSNDNRPQNWPNWQAQSRSMHAARGGVNVCFADGSVRWVINSITPQIWDAMLTRGGGEAFNRSFDM